MATKKKMSPKKQGSTSSIDLTAVFQRLDEIDSRFDMIEPPQWLCLKCGEIHVTPDTRTCSYCKASRPTR